MMSTKQFDLRLTHIDEQSGAMQERVDGYRDQQLAKLFVECEWSQEKLAEHLAAKWGEEVSPMWVSYRLRFGRFLTFFNTTCVGTSSWRLPCNLAEGTFRNFWDATTASGDFSGKRANTEAAVKDEERRFAEVVEEMKSGRMIRPKKQIRAALINHAVSREWLTAEQMAKRIACAFNNRPVPVADVQRTLRILSPTPTSPYRVEKAGEGDMAKYRIIKVKGTIPSRKQLSQWASELIPMMDEIIREMNKHPAARSDASLAAIASKIRKVLESVEAKSLEAIEG